MSPPTFSQPSASSTYCSKSKKMKNRPNPYTTQTTPQLAAPSSPFLPHHNTGIESSIADLVTELAGLMLAPSNNIQAVKRPQHRRSHHSYNQHRKQMDQTSLQQHHLYPAMHQNVSSIQTCQGFGLGPHPLLYPHAALPSLPSHSSGPSPFHPMYGNGGVWLPRLEPAAALNQHDQLQKANAMQHAVPKGEQNLALLIRTHSTATSASQGFGLGATSENGLAQVPSSVGQGSYPLWNPYYHATLPLMPSQSVGPSSPYPVFGSGGFRQPPLEPAAVSNQHEQIQKANVMQHTVPPDEQNSIIPTHQNSTATSASQGIVPVASSQNSKGSVPSSFGHGSTSGPQMPSQHVGPSLSNSVDGSCFSLEDGDLHLPCTTSTAVTDQCGRMQVAIQLTMPPTCREPSTPTEKKTSLSALQGLQLPCTASTTGTDEYDRMLVAIQLTIPSAAESPSIPVLQNVESNVATHCPLDPSTTFTSKNWTLDEVIEIESHINTACSCPHGPHPSLQDLVVTGLEDHERSTPLLMACLHGDLDAVKRIVDGWGINVCKANVHPLLGIPVEEVTPLFLAASKCHSNIVLYLIEKGANVSARTHSEVDECSGLTPLHAAVRLGGSHGNEDTSMQISTIRCLLESGANPSALPYDGVPIWLHGDTEDGQIITLLVQWGLDLSQRSPGRSTPLHKWARQLPAQHKDMSLDVVKMLVDKGGDLQARDGYNFSVILVAANGDGNLPNIPVLNFLLERDDIKSSDKRDALELAGAVILGHDANHEKFPLGFQYWRQSVSRRGTEYYEPRKESKSKIRQHSEWSTLDDIMEIEQQPSLREMQSLLVRIRLQSGLNRSLRAVHEHCLPHLFEFLDKEVDENRTLTQILDVSWATLKMLLFRFPMERELLSQITHIFQQLVTIIQDLPYDDPNVNATTLKTFLELVVMTDLRVGNTYYKGDWNYFENQVYNIRNVFTILSTHPEMVNNDMKRPLEQLVRRYSGRTGKLIGIGMLHAACHDLNNTTVPTVRLLLEFGANPNTLDYNGYSPLHILAEDLENAEIRDATARLFLDFGAHLDMVNRQRKTPADLWLEENNEQWLGVGWNDMPDWLKGDFPKLTCLCAGVIRRHQLPYKDGSTLPASLIPFIKMH